MYKCIKSDEKKVDIAIFRIFCGSHCKQRFKVLFKLLLVDLNEKLRKSIKIKAKLLEMVV